MKITSSKLVSLITDPKSENKASIKTMIRLKDEFGGLPTKFIDDNGNPDFDYIVRVYTTLCQQDNPEITHEDVFSGLDMGKMPEAMNLIREMLSFAVPSDDLDWSAISSEEQDVKDTPKNEATNTENEGEKPKN